MSWGISKIGHVEAVAAELAVELPDNAHVSQDTRNYISAELATIARHPGTGVKVEAGGHTYHDGNHLTYSSTVRIETVRLSKLPTETPA